MDEAAAARDAALRYLASADRSEDEVRRKLRQAGHAEETVEEALAFLRAAGLVDDVRLARDWTESRGIRRQIGPRRLEAELRRKGIDAEIVREAVEGLSEEQTVEAAIAYALRRPDASRLDDPAARRRLCAALQRRGYDWETIEQVIAAIEENQ
jgi:regulatory protein